LAPAAVAPAIARVAAHPNARFTTPCRQCPVIAKEWKIQGCADRRDPVWRTPRQRRATRYRVLRLANGTFLAGNSQQ